MEKAKWGDGRLDKGKGQAKGRGSRVGRAEALLAPWRLRGRSVDQYIDNHNIL